MKNGPVFDRGSVTAAQNAFHDEAHDYDASSPHLRHPRIRNCVVRDLTELVSGRIDETGSCHVVEIGAGHGTFTRTLLAAGARVTVTEASQSSADVLRERYRDDDRVNVYLDETGEQTLGLSSSFDLVVCVSVLHHIPDYLRFIDSMSLKLVPGGSFYSVQDPLRYSRMSKSTHRVHLAAYMLWRVLQGNYSRGFATRWRRLRGVYNGSPSDLVEYHVVRDGVDEEAILNLVQSRFKDARIFSYWSTQSPALQALGERARLKTTFGVIARGRTTTPPPLDQPAHPGPDTD